MKRRNITPVLLAVLAGASQVFAATQSSYPTKTAPVSGDKTLITDSQDSSKTKQAALSFALVGDCTGFPCLDGSSDGGNYIKLYAGTGSYWTALQGGAPAANRLWRLPIAAPPSAGATYLMNMDEYGQMGFVSPSTFQSATINASGFNGNLSTTDDTLQEIAQKVDDLVVGGGSFDEAGDYTLSGAIGFTGPVDFSGADITGISGSLPTDGVEGEVLVQGASGPDFVAPLTPVAGQSITLPVVGDTVTINAWGDDAAYGAGWNGSIKPVSQNAIYDKIESMGGGGTTTISGLTDWPAGVTATELSYVDGATSNIQAQLNAISAGSGGTVSAITSEPYSDVACTGAKYDTVANRFYLCIDGYHTAYLSGTTHSKTTPATTTDVTYVISTNESGGSRNLTTAHVFGQSWTVPSGGGGVLKSVVFKPYANSGANITCRVGTSSGQLDMTTSYQSGSGTVSSSGEVSISFATGPNIAVGGTYAVACHQDADTGYMVSASDVYAGGNEYYMSSLGWDLTGQQDPVDFYFKYVVAQ